MCLLSLPQLLTAKRSLRNSKFLVNFLKKINLVYITDYIQNLEPVNQKWVSKRV